MKRFLLLSILCLSIAPALGEVQWFTDANAALEKARQENKFLLLDFTGSDWCGWCMKLKSEVFDQPEFAAFAQDNLVLVEVDFPKRKQLDPAQAEVNNRLAEAFHIRGYPTLILLDGSGRLMGEMGYLPGGPKVFDAELGRLLKVNPPQPAPDKPEPRRTPPSLPKYAASVPNQYGALALKGISGTKERRLVQINNATLMVGEVAHVKVQDHDVVVVCKEIRDDSVLITADDKPMELKLRSH